MFTGNTDPASERTSTSWQHEQTRCNHLLHNSKHRYFCYLIFLSGPRDLTVYPSLVKFLDVHFLSTDRLDDVELAGVCTCGGSFCSAV